MGCLLLMEGMLNIFIRIAVCGIFMSSFVHLIMCSMDVCAWNWTSVIKNKIRSLMQVFQLPLVLVCISAHTQKRDEVYVYVILLVLYDMLKYLLYAHLVFC